MSENTAAFDLIAFVDYCQNIQTAMNQMDWTREMVEEMSVACASMPSEDRKDLAGTLMRLGVGLMGMAQQVERVKRLFASVPSLAEFANLMAALDHTRLTADTLRMMHHEIEECGFPENYIPLSLKQHMDSLFEDDMREADEDEAMGEYLKQFAEKRAAEKPAGNGLHVVAGQDAPEGDEASAPF